MPGPIICATCGKSLTLWEIDHGHKCRLDLDSGAKRSGGDTNDGVGQERFNRNTQKINPLQVCPGCGQRSLYRNNNCFECLNLKCKRTFTPEDPCTLENTRLIELITCKHCNQQFSTSDYEAHLNSLARSTPKGKGIRWLVVSVAMLSMVGGIAFFAISNKWLQKETGATQTATLTPSVTMPLTIAPSAASPSATPTQRLTPTPGAGENPNALTPTLKPLPTASPTVKETATPGPAPITTPKIQELYQYMLDLINKDRGANSLSPVVLGNNGAAQKHAQEMADNGYLSHWGLDGMKPYMRYTRAGGFNYEAENTFYSTYGSTTWSISGVLVYTTVNPRKCVSDLED